MSKGGLADGGLSEQRVRTQQIVRFAKVAYNLYLELEAALDHAPQCYEKVSGSRGASRSPRGKVIDAREAIKDALRSVARIVIEARGVAVDSESPKVVLDLIRNNAGWLASNSHVQEISRRLRDISEAPEIWYLAHGDASDWVKTGACSLIEEGMRCGGDLYQNRDDRRIMCVLCGTVGAVEWWIGSSVRKQIPLDAYAVAAYLTVRWRRPVTAALIRSWARSPEATGVSAMSANGQTGSDGIGRLGGRYRVMYDLKAVLAHAERVWGSGEQNGL